jgi:hypothetical protein
MEDLMIPLFWFFSGFVIGAHLVARLAVRYWKPKEDPNV